MNNEERRKELLEKINKIESHIATLNEQKKKFVYELEALHSEHSFAINGTSFQVHENASAERYTTLGLSAVQRVLLKMGRL